MSSPQPPQPEATGARPTEAEARPIQGMVAFYIKQKLQQGVSPEEIKKRLLEMEYPAETLPLVDQVLEELCHPAPDATDSHRAALKQAGDQNRRWGALIFLFGLAVSLWSYAQASAEGRPSFMVAGGAVVCGAIQYLRGVSQVAKAARL